MRIYLLLLCLLVSLVGCKAAKEAQEAKAEYDKKSQNSEAKMLLTQMGRGAESWYQMEHVDPANPMGIITSAFPLSPTPICTAGGSRAEQVDPSQTDWALPTWSALQFVIESPHHFAYCYQSDADGSAFAAWADADDTRLCITGTSAADQPTFLPPLEQSTDDPCAIVSSPE